MFVGLIPCVSLTFLRFDVFLLKHEHKRKCSVLNLGSDQRMQLIQMSPLMDVKETSMLVSCCVYKPRTVCMMFLRIRIVEKISRIHNYRIQS